MDDIWDKLVKCMFIVGFGLLFIGIGCAFINETIERVEKESSCEKIGMEYYYTNGQTYCLDKQNQAHYVKIDCEWVSLFKHDCTPRLISVGDVWTVGVD